MPEAKPTVSREMQLRHTLFLLSSPTAPGDKAALAASLRDDIFANGAHRS